MLVALARSRVPGALHRRAWLVTPAAGHVLQFQGRQQLVDREAARAGVAGGRSPARRDPPRRRRAASTWDHESCSQLARRSCASFAAITGV